MGQSVALYRKYRGKKLADIIGQDHITKTLASAIKQGHISHAYLFTGPRGVGKTSVARILAYQINDLAYTDENQPIDIIEIDAASNRRIDEIRDLREKVHIAPTHARYKVYIIDEVHMLTKEAFNALLKTLEEPPAHVVFVLATTEAHKLPDTIISRTQRHSFRPISIENSSKHLKRIAKQEKISIDDDALKLIAQHGHGSFRDSISLLDQVRSHETKKISRGNVEELLGLAPEEEIDQLLQLALHQPPADMVEKLDKILSWGVSPANVAQQLAERLRQQYLDKTLSIAPQDAIAAIDKLSQTPLAYNQPLHIELALLELNLLNRIVSDAGQMQPVATNRLHETNQIKAKPKATTNDIQLKAVKKDDWAQILRTIKKRNSALYSILRLAAADTNGERLKLRFGFPFHLKRAQTAVHTQLIAEAAQQTFGKPQQLVFEVDTSLQTLISDVDKKAAKKTNDQHTNQVIETFGGGEVVAI